MLNMKIEVINKDDNNFVVAATNVNLSNKQYMNFCSRLKGALSEKYGRGTMLFIIDNNLNNSSFNITIPNGYYQFLGEIEKIVSDIYSSMRK